MGRWEAELTFESAVKGRLRIADLGSDLCNAAARGFEQLRADEVANV
jgi:hypothetical protein